MKDENLKINEIEDRIKTLKKKKEDLIKSNRYMSKQQYRKERANRLIQTGALAEKYFKISHVPVEDREEIFKMFSAFVISNMPKKFKE